jgi:hypothetical protein
VSDAIVRAARDYVRGRHVPDWPALLARLRDATDSPEQKTFADEMIECLTREGKNPTRAKASVRDLLKRSGVTV